MGFFSNFGGSDSRRDLRNGANAFIDETNQGRGRALGAINTGESTALDFLQGGREGGLAALSQLMNAVGVNGVPAQQQFHDDFQDDPGFNAELDARLDAVGRSASSRGLSFSGRTLSALADEGQQFRRSAFNDRLDRLSGLSSLGQQAAGQSAGIVTNNANQRAGIELNTGQALGNNQLNLASGLSSTRSAGLNNAIGLAGLGTKALSAGGFFGEKGAFG